MPTEYGIRPYANMLDDEGNETPYVDTMKAPTWAYALAQEVQKFSEFMKPYLAPGDYPDMETGYPMYSLPRPSDGGPDTVDYNPNKPGCAITCNSSLYCADPVKCHPSISHCPPGKSSSECKQAFQFQVWVNDKSHGRWKYFSTVLQSKTNPETGAVFYAATPGTSIDPLQIYPPESVGRWHHFPDEVQDKVRVLMIDPAGNRCATEITVFCQKLECCQDPDTITMTFDDDSTPDTIAQSNSITCYVLNGCQPYSWAVSGTGFTFTSSSTVGLSNTLNASGTACGTATCTVTDKCGTVVTFYILCTTGAWTGSGLTCPGTFPTLPLGSWSESIVSNCYVYVAAVVQGREKQYQQVDCCVWADSTPCADEATCGTTDLSDTGDWCHVAGPQSYPPLSPCMWPGGFERNLCSCQARAAGTTCIGCRIWSTAHYYWTC